MIFTRHAGPYDQRLTVDAWDEAAEFSVDLVDGLTFDIGCLWRIEDMIYVKASDEVARYRIVSGTGETYRCLLLDVTAVPA